MPNYHIVAANCGGGSGGGWLLNVCALLPARQSYSIYHGPTGLTNKLSRGIAHYIHTLHNIHT